jgi:hypothetical protein
LRCLAATIPSPPLFPGPHNTNMFLIDPLVSTLHTVVAIAYPANSINISNVNPTSSDINSTSNSYDTFYPMYVIYYLIIYFINNAMIFYRITYDIYTIIV